MEQNLINSYIIFLYSIGLGISLGIIYDVFRVIRIWLNPKNLNFFIQDILYFIIASLMTFLFVLKFNLGQTRFYILLGEALGWIIYHLTIGEFIYKKTIKLIHKKTPR